jgi:hypothetical protein
VFRNPEEYQGSQRAVEPVMMMMMINDLHLLQPRSSIYSNGVYYMGIKTFNHLPSFITLSDNKNQFKSILKNYLSTEILLVIEGFFNNEE